MKQLLLIDTDIGDDIDDALALALAVQSPEVDVLGVVTTFRNTDMRARLAKELLTAYGRQDISVCAGTGHPLIREEDVTQIPCQCRADTVSAVYDTEQSWLEFYRSVIEAHPHEVTILAIAPLTNIALLMRTYPQTAARIKDIVLMGGCYYNHYTEWNIVGDPEAAAIVFSFGVPIRAIGLDVTLKCRLTQEQLSRALSTVGEASGRGYLSDLLNRWKDQHDWLPILHDPLALAALLDPTLFTYEQERVDVITQGSARGMTYNVAGLRWDNCEAAQDSHVSVARTVDCKRFMKLFFDRLF